MSIYRCCIPYGSGRGGTCDGCRTGSQRNSFLYADKEKKLPFILKKKDIRINRNMTAKELKIGTPVALQKKYVF